MKKFKQFKQWLSNKLPTFPEDVQKHFFVVYALSIPITLFGAVANPLLGLIGIISLLVGAALWELPTLIENKFTYKSVMESIKDFGVAFAAVFTSLNSLLYIYVKLS